MLTMRTKIISALSIAVFFISCNGSKRMASENFVPQIKEIWNNAPHNAFTDLIYYKGVFYCSFREGSGHVPGTNGVGRIIKSKDGNNWEDFALISKEGVDLRDQKISVMPDGKILCLMGGSIYDVNTKPSKLLSLHPHVSFLTMSGNFTAPERTVVQPDDQSWIWRLTWYKGTGYGINYSRGNAILVKTTDGKNYAKVSDIDIDGYPNESTIQFDDSGKMYVMIRREQGDHLGALATSIYPYTQWNISKMDLRLGGPHFLFSPDKKKLIVGTRLYLPQGHKTGIVITDLNGKTIKTFELESGGDCSYPGMVIKDKKLWVSYYSSHKGKSNIYFTQIPLNVLLDK